MKKTLVSLATASLIASTAMAADKGIDFDVTGQTVVYYNTATTNAKNGNDLFNRNASKANVGVQLNLASDLKNGFIFGAQLSYLDALGLNKNLVGDTNVMQVGGSIPNTQALGATKTTDDLALTKIFIAKKIANTTVKIGRQELPKSLSPLAFTEGWDVFKNTFEAILVVNSDLPDTTLVGAYVGGATGLNLSTVDDLQVSTTTLDVLAVNKTAYMLTVANTSLPMTALTASYYALSGVNNALHADALWLDAKIADKSLPMGLNIGVQAGQISGDTPIKSTTAFGLKVSAKPMPALSVTAAYTSVNDGTVKVVNTGTGKKTPLYTQMIANQGSISSDNSTMMLKGVYSLGNAGKVIAQISNSQDNSNVGRNLTDTELVYKTKVSGVNLLAAFVNLSWSEAKAGVDSKQIARVVARYKF